MRFFGIDLRNAWLRRAGKPTGGNKKAIDSDAAYTKASRFYELNKLRIEAINRTFVLFACAIAAAVLLLGYFKEASSDVVTVGPITVSEDLQKQGYSSEFISGMIVDKLRDIQQDTHVLRPPDSYRDNIGKDIRIKIPNTDTTVDELWRYIRRWTGHEITVRGQLYESADGRVAFRIECLGVRNITADNAADAVYSGAKYVFKATQPYKYAAWIHDRRVRAGQDVESEDPSNEYGIDHDTPLSALEGTLATAGSDAEMAWMYSLWSRFLVETAAGDAAREKALSALALDDNLVVAHANLADAYGLLGDAGREFQERKRIVEHQSDMQRQLVPAGVDVFERNQRALIASLRGSFGTAQTLDLKLQNLAATQRYLPAFTVDQTIQAAAAHHDLEAALGYQQSRYQKASDVLARLAAEPRPIPEAANMVAFFASADDYPAMWSGLLTQRDNNKIPSEPFSRLVAPWLAYAAAKTGEPSAPEMERLISTDASCYMCLIARGRLAGLRRERERADEWFARAVAAAPMLPQAYYYWGETLATLGDERAAMAKLSAARLRGPDWAEPSELIAEIVARRDPRASLRWFAAAAEKAPNWSRPQEHWGEALNMSGQTEAARLHRDLGLRLSMRRDAALAQARSIWSE